MNIILCKERKKFNEMVEQDIIYTPKVEIAVSKASDALSLPRFSRREAFIIPRGVLIKPYKYVKYGGLFKIINPEDYLDGHISEIHLDTVVINRDIRKEK